MPHCLPYGVSVALKSLETFSRGNRPQFQSPRPKSQIQRSFHLDWKPHYIQSRCGPGKSWDTLLKKQTTISKSCRTRQIQRSFHLDWMPHCLHGCCGPGKSWDSLHQETDHSFKVMSLELDTTVLPSGLKATLFTEPLWPWKVLRHSPEETDHSFKVLSHEQRSFHLDWKQHWFIQSLWPWKVLRHSPEETDHSFKVSRAWYNGLIWTECHTAIHRGPGKSWDTLHQKQTTVSKYCRPSKIQRSFHLDWKPHCVYIVLWPWKVLRHFHWS